MFRIFKCSLVLLSVLSLSACLDVKDKSDDKVVDALTEQNKILQEQANQAAQTKTTISLTGVVNNLSTGAKAVNATVKIKVGSTFSEPVAVAASSGAFQIDNLPADSDFELIVHSTTNTFMDRVYFGKTRATSASGKVYQDFGVLSVAAGVEHKFKIKNAVTNDSITSLNLYANSNVGNASGYEQYLHKSTYDATTQEYKITVPERIGLSVFANLDINNDGKIEYRPEANLYDTTLVINNLDNSNTIYLVDLNTNAKVKVRISLLDSLLQPITNASVNVNDSLNGAIAGTYQAATNQYVIDAVLDSSLTVMIPAFSAGGVSYNSSSVQITRASFDATTYVLNASGSHYYSANFSFAADANKVFDVVVQPSALTVYSNLTALVSSAVIDPANPIFKVFYSGAVALKSDSVSVLKKGVLHVVRGNDSTTDLILSGTTLIEAVDESVAVDTKVDLNNTLVTVTPKAPLAGGYTYSFAIDTLTDLFLNIDANLYGDSSDIVVKNTDAFSINDVKLDNNDFFTNGTLIKPNNTAGDPVSLSIYSWGSSVYLYLPPSVESVKTLTLRKEQVTQNNVTASDVGNFEIVVNGSINSYYKTRSVSVAYNENITGNNSYVQKGSAVVDGQWYLIGTNEYLADNTSANANSITFTYALETKDGVKSTGTITLPVL